MTDVKYYQLKISINGMEKAKLHGVTDAEIAWVVDSYRVLCYATKPQYKISLLKMGLHPDHTTDRVFNYKPKAD